MLGQMLVALSRVEEARPMANEIIEFSRKAGDKRAEHSGFHFLADCALIEGDCRKSIGLYDQALTLAEAVEDRLEISFEIEGIAMSLAGLGDPETAVRLSSAARAEWARHGVKIQIRFWDALVERYLVPARATLGPGRYEAAARAGADVAFEDAIREAHAAAATILKGPEQRKAQTAQGPNNAGPKRRTARTAQSMLHGAVWQVAPFGSSRRLAVGALCSQTPPLTPP